jgi:serine/threonine-protein kinase
MGAVYEAMDLRLERRVAVKVLSGQRFGDPTSLRRFEREAQTAARLTHQNIVRVYDYGLLHDTEGAYLVMELLEGETLGSAIKRLGKIEPARAGEWLDQALEGIKAAHEMGVLHRDLKPENIFLARAEKQLPPLVKILDFGLAKFTQPEVSERPSITTDGVTMGTFGYMSPEQLIGGRLDQRSDIFSFGVILAETLTGRNPFTGQNYAAFLTSVLHNSFHLSGDEPEIRHLDEILQKCLAKDPDARFSSIAQLQHELIPVLKNCPVIESLGRTRRDTKAIKTSSMPEQEAQTQITDEPPESGFTISG